MQRSDQLFSTYLWKNVVPPFIGKYHPLYLRGVINDTHTASVLLSRRAYTPESDSYRFSAFGKLQSKLTHLQMCLHRNRESSEPSALQSSHQIFLTELIPTINKIVAYYEHEKRHWQKHVEVAPGMSPFSKAVSSNSTVKHADTMDSLMPHSSEKIDASFSELPPSPYEHAQAKLLSTAQQLLLYHGMKVTRAVFLRVRNDIALFLLGNYLLSASSFRGPHQNLQESLFRRAAKSYVELLTFHEVDLDRKEWSKMCSTLSPRHSESVNVAVLPLISSTSTSDSSSMPVSSVVSAKEMYSLLQWSRTYDPHKHLRTADIDLIIRRTLQESSDRSERKGPVDQQKLDRLLQLWESSRSAEQDSGALRRESGKFHTHHKSVRVAGTTLVSSRDEEDDGYFGSTRAFHEDLAMGKWRSVLQHVLQKYALLGNGKHHHIFRTVAFLRTEGEAGQNKLMQSCVKDAKDVIAFMQLGPLATGPLVQHKLITSKWQMKSVPQAYLAAPVSTEENELVQHPPTAGLDVRRDIQKESSSTSARSPVSPLRHRLWALWKLPRHLPLTLVQFDTSQGKLHPLPYLCRSPGRELLPWLLVGIHGLVSTLSLQKDAKVDDPDWLGMEVLQSTRQAVLDYLFHPPQASYMALNEYCVSYFQMICITLSSCLYADYRQRVSSDIVSSDTNGNFEKVLPLSFQTLFSPPLPTFYCETKGKTSSSAYRIHEVTIAWWNSHKSDKVERDTADLCKEEGGALTRKIRKALDDFLFTSLLQDTTLDDKSSLFSKLYLKPEAFQYFSGKVCCLRNFHFSLYMEGFASLAPLRAILGALSAETNRCGPPVLSPETAALLLTSLVLHLISPSIAEDGMDELLRAHGVDRLFFAVPLDSLSSAIPSYFKGIYHPTFFQVLYPMSGSGSSEVVVGSLSEVIDAGEWDGSAALLVGRSRRFCNRFPTTCTEHFFHMFQRKADVRIQARFQIPPLRLVVCSVDLRVVVRHFHKKAQSDLCVPRHKAPSIVAGDLPYGLFAVQKPPGWNCTCHANHFSLHSFLQAALPWKKSHQSDVPVVHQHGLVNRIDVGTSGVVLVAQESDTLHLAIAATSTHRRVEKSYRALVKAVTRHRHLAENWWFLSPRGIIASHVFAHGASAGVSHSNASNRMPVSLLDQRLGVTKYRVLEFFPKHGVYFVDVSLVSGRRHQIRQHFASIGFPLIADSRYGAEASSFGMQRPALHAFRVDILCPHTAGRGQDSCCASDVGRVVVESPLPKDMVNALQWLRGQK